LYEFIRPEHTMIAVADGVIVVLMHPPGAPGDHAVVIAPPHQSVYEVARSAGCEVTHCPQEAGASGRYLIIDRLRRSVTDRTHLLVANFQNNPTGYLPTPQDFGRIGGACSGEGAVPAC
jgi:aspartate/methionine/tyrosine aminotransferase